MVMMPLVSLNVQFMLADDGIKSRAIFSKSCHKVATAVLLKKALPKIRATLVIKFVTKTFQK